MNEWTPCWTVPGLWFHEGSHTYVFEGEIVPSVTRVLAPLSSFAAVPAWRLEANRIRGQEVHDLIDGFLDGRTTVAEGPWARYLAHALDFIHTTGATVLATERRVYHPTLRYAGTADVILGIGDDVCLVDWKSGAELYPSYGPQLAAYAEALNVTNGDTSNGELPTITRRMVVRLRPGGWSLDHYADPGDFPVFRNLLAKLREDEQRNGFEY